MIRFVLALAVVSATNIVLSSGQLLAQDKEVQEIKSFHLVAETRQMREGSKPIQMKTEFHFQLPMSWRWSDVEASGAFGMFSCCNGEVMWQWRETRGTPRAYTRIDLNALRKEFDGAKVDAYALVNGAPNLVIFVDPEHPLWNKLPVDRSFTSSLKFAKTEALNTLPTRVYDLGEQARLWFGKDDGILRQRHAKGPIEQTLEVTNVALNPKIDESRLFTIKPAAGVEVADGTPDLAKLLKIITAPKK